MDLDDRASRAADSLRNQVERSIDLAGARASIRSAAGQRADHVRRLRIGATGLAVVAVLSAFALLASQGGSGRLRTDNGESGRELAGDGGGRSAAIIGALPSGPVDGKASWRLPVVAEPQGGLEDGDTVTIYGRGFEPNESLGIVQCTSEADVDNAGVGACQLSSTGAAEGSFGAVTYADASTEGTVVHEVVVRRYITTPEGGKVDCASAPERCLIGMGAISNYDQSGGSYINFAGAPPFPEPAMVLDPAGPYAPGQLVVAKVGALLPGRPVRLSQCIEDRCQKLIDGKAGANGAVDLGVVLQPSIVDDETGDEIACDDRCVLRANGIGVKGASSAPRPADVPLAFTSAVPSAPVATEAAPPATTTTADAVTSSPATPVTPPPPPITGTTVTVPTVTEPPVTIPTSEPADTTTTTVPSDEATTSAQPPTGGG